MCKLSICIPTFNRADYIGQTLDSIVSQIEPGVEVVIVDGSRDDRTENIVGTYQKKWPAIRYIRSETGKDKPSNEGFDRDCSLGVERSTGDYCWLMTDDDLLKPGAVKRVLEQIDDDYQVIVANADVFNVDFTESLVEKRIKIPADRVYSPQQIDAFVSDVGSHLTFVGAVIIKRTVWLSRSTEKYFGSGFIHVGVMFDEPFVGDVLVTAEPLVSIRFGNAHWSGRAFQIWMLNWPKLIWGFSCVSDVAKQAVSPKEPWRKLTTLLLNRAMGMYSEREYRQFIADRLHSGLARWLSKAIAKLPRRLLYVPAWICISLISSDRKFVLFCLKDSWAGKA